MEMHKNEPQQHSQLMEQNCVFAQTGRALPRGKIQLPFPTNSVHFHNHRCHTVTPLPHTSCHTSLTPVSPYSNSRPPDDLVVVLLVVVSSESFVSHFFRCRQECFIRHTTRTTGSHRLVFRRTPRYRQPNRLWVSSLGWRLQNLMATFWRSAAVCSGRNISLSERRP